MTTPQIMPTRPHALQYSYSSGSARSQVRRDSLGGGCGVPVLSYTSLSSPRKRPFVDEDEDVFTSSRLSSPVKRSRPALRDTNMAIYCDDSGSEVELQKNSTVLGEKKSLVNIKASATKGSLKKLNQFKLIDSKKVASTKKRPLGSTSPSPQRVARKPTTLHRFTSSPRSSEAGRHKALERARTLYSSSPLRTAVSSSDESDSGVPLAATAAAMTVIKESWIFDIHEDSHAETMQNLMEHSATVLDISDESEDEKWGNDEVAQKGKENISPERMAELLAGAGAGSMQVDAKERRAPKEKRAALGELEVRKFYPKEDDEDEKGEEEMKKEAPEVSLDLSNIPSLDASRSRAHFQVWASEGESEEESDEDAGVPLTPPKGLEQKVKIVQEDEFDESASECGASDKEN